MMDGAGSGGMWLIFFVTVMCVAVIFIILRNQNSTPRFESPDAAIANLHSVLVKVSGGVIYIPRNRQLPPDAWAAISYLTTQWDYDWTDE